MVTSTSLKKCLAFVCGTMFVLYVYSVSSKEGLFFNTTQSLPKTASLSFLGNLTPKRPSDAGRGPVNYMSTSNAVTTTASVKEAESTAAVKDVTSYPEMVLILAYMRTGSTLTADVIQQHNDTFYSFEPVMNIWHGARSTYTNGSSKKFRTNDERVKESLQQLTAWFTCDLDRVDLETFRFVFMNFGIKTKPTKTCMRKYSKLHFNQTVYNECLVPLINRCKSSKVRVVKTIRFYAKDIENLMKTFPTLKVIHLVRDPRGILTSRKRVDPKRTMARPLNKVVTDLCERIMNDYETVKYFKKKFPGRIKILRYEELATYPIETVTDLYSFIGLKPTETIYKYVIHVTSSKDNVEKDYNTARKDSVFTANAWRIKTSKNVTDIIDKICEAMYEKYGYLKPKTIKELKNITGARLWIDTIEN